MEKTIREQLFVLQDITYRDFTSGLLPTVSPDTVIGVRTPELRKLAKRLAGTRQAQEFLTELPHAYYEENNLHGFLLEQIKDYAACVDALESFLPYIDNWGTCDCIAPKVLKTNTDDLLVRIRRWIASGRTYHIRFGVGMLMRFYLDDLYRHEYADLVAGIRSDEYYVNMMRAWYFATALAKQYDDVLPYLSGRLLDVWTHNKTISKAVESFRVSSEHKEALKRLRIRR